MINNVRVAASGEVGIADVLMHVKREAADFDETATTGYFMSLGLYINSIIGYLVRYYLPFCSISYFLKVLG